MQKSKRYLSKRFSIVVALVVVLVTGLGVPALARATVTVGAIYIGPIGDYGWSFVGHRDLSYLADKYDWIDYVYAEAVPFPEAEGVILDFIDRGATVIFAHSFGYLGVLRKLAPEFPRVKFHFPGGFAEHLMPNLATYYWNEYEVRFLTGILSGLMTKTDTLGFVAAHPILRLIWGINAYLYGARMVNPDVRFHVTFAGAWYDPPREKEIAHALIDLGADFITYHTDSPAAGIAAQARGVYAFGKALDLAPFAPDVAVTTAILDWKSLLKHLIAGAADGTWQTGVYDWGMAEGTVQMSPLGAMVPPEVREKIELLAHLIREGHLIVPRFDDRMW